MATEYLFFFFLLLFLLHYVFRRPIKNSPPGPWPAPLLGNLLQLGHLPHRSFAELARQYGPVMSLRLGLVPYVVISSPAAAAQVLRKHDQILSYRYITDALRAQDHDKLSIAFIPPGPAWRALRKICNSHIFNHQCLDERKGLRERKVRELVSVLQKSAKQSEAVDVGRAAFTVTINLMSNTIFSEDMSRYEEESSADFKYLIRQASTEIGSPNVSDFFPFLRWFDLQGRRRKTGQVIVSLMSICSMKVEDRLNLRQWTDQKDFLDVLLDAIADKELDRTTVEALLPDLFGAGSDSSSTTVEWAMTELLRNPNAMDRAREEVKAAMEGSKKDTVGESDIVRMPYLQAVVSETLRLHPPAPFLVPRQASENANLEFVGKDGDILSYVVQSGTVILVNAWAMSRDPVTWGSDADMFRPERFIEGDCGDMDYKGQYFEFIPFGAGRRICPGMPLAARMMHLLLANLLWFFEWRLPEGMLPADISMEENFGLSLCKAKPLLAIPVIAK